MIPKLLKSVEFKRSKIHILIEIPIDFPIDYGRSLRVDIILVSMQMDVRFGFSRSKSMFYMKKSISRKVDIIVVEVDTFWYKIQKPQIEKPSQIRIRRVGFT